MAEFEQQNQNGYETFPRNQVLIGINDCTQFYWLKLIDLVNSATVKMIYCFRTFSLKAREINVEADNQSIQGKSDIFSKLRELLLW